MDKLDVILWVIGGGFTLMLIMWHRMENKFDKVDTDIKDVRTEIKELRTSINRMEGAFYSKECCMLKEERHLKKAE